MTIWTAPKWVHSLYARFPLAVLDHEDELPRDPGPSMWIAPCSSERSWASSDPECLRAQLLFLLRGVPVTFKEWYNPSAAPGGQLPALQVDQSLVSAGDLRAWLDQAHSEDELQGMPDQATFDRAVALAHLINGRIKARRHLDLPVPPVLVAGLVTPLPASLTGDGREVDIESEQKRAEEAWDAVDVAIGEGWALDAARPTPLDALIAAHVHVNRRSLSERHELLKYADKVLDCAQRRI